MNNIDIDIDNNRWTFFDIGFGSYLLLPDKSTDYQDLVNRIGELEDQIKELIKNGINAKTK